MERFVREFGEVEQLFAAGFAGKRDWQVRHWTGDENARFEFECAV